MTLKTASRIEGIGAPVEPSFQPDVVDKMIRVPDAASIATVHFLERVLNRRCGGSTGTNLYAVFRLISQMRAEGKSGSLVLICDGGRAPYTETYFNPEWLRKNRISTQAPCQAIGAFLDNRIMEEV